MAPIIHSVPQGETGSLPPLPRAILPAAALDVPIAAAAKLVFTRSQRL